ncbi:hypothetical protein KIN20_000637 [Parelaphostrongylus tenuis]|uniref:Uncharacterized protein n=1 Tax=Parelaphostrongylus tenuis TaxID=148309 RepID=A0AAD5LVT0_PARTN|nr:hypothetical protein KIN20_000637 [Parelaphostrongylus tenuis]
MIWIITALIFQKSLSLMSTKADLLRAQFSLSKVLAVTNGTPIKGYLLPSTDAHQSEYLADHDFRVKFLTGFTGSNAYVAVTNEKAVLWTDGRYFTQASEQLVPPFELLKQGQPDSISVEDFIAKELTVGDWIGIDPSLHTYEGGQQLIKTLESMGFHVAPIRGNLVDEFWNDRPSLPAKSPIILLPEEHGRCVKDKLKELRERISNKKCNSIVLSALDDIMWLLNIRGFDIKHNPLAYSYLLVTTSEVHLFMDKANDEMRNYLEQENIVLHPYAEAYDFISEWNRKQKSENAQHRVFVPTSTNYLFGSLFSSSSVVNGSPVQVMKGVKNRVELEGMRQSHIRDSATLVSFLMWIEAEMIEGRSHSEIDMASKVDSLRAGTEKYVDLSFSTISAAGDHAAKPHYFPEGEEGKRLVTANQVYLLDSGAHYRDGTTDVTRTIWIARNSSVPDDFIQHNTLVLKGHINLANSVFPQAITASIGHRAVNTGSDYWVREGMVLTIEPGYYLVGKWGIRIENCYEVVKAKVPSGADFLGFRALTLVPIQTSIIDKSLLSPKEIEWLNAYHDEVLSTIGGYLQKTNKTKEFEWLKKQCAHI